MAESILDQGYCDIVGMSRCSLADPDMPNKAKAGEDARIRPCIRCMQGCVTSTYLQIPMRCCVNPEMNREYLYTFEDQPAPKKVLVVGGGPAGMQAAIAAAAGGTMSPCGRRATPWADSLSLPPILRERATMSPSPSAPSVR